MHIPKAYTSTDSSYFSSYISGAMNSGVPGDKNNQLLNCAGNLDLSVIKQLSVMNLPENRSFKIIVLVHRLAIGRMGPLSAL